MTGDLFAVSGWEASGAEFNETRTHRYTLWRRWSPQAPVRAGFLFDGGQCKGSRPAAPLVAPGGTESLLGVVMLNPSTADERELDPTLRRCQSFARLWGLDGFVIANLFALRSTDPRKLYGHDDPVGALNDQAILRVVERCKITLAGWGNHGKLHGRADQVRELLGDRPVWCLKKNKDGSPQHPLYVSKNTVPVLFSGKGPMESVWAE